MNSLLLVLDVLPVVLNLIAMLIAIGILVHMWRHRRPRSRVKPQGELKWVI